MSKETQPTKSFTPAEQGFQRLLLRDQKDQSQPGDGLRRFGINVSMFGLATAADLAESHLIDAVIRTPLHNKIHELKEKGPAFVDAAQKAQGIQFAAEFVEEWASDSIYANLANGWVRAMTGVDDAAYVSETSAFLAEWGNVLSQVFLQDRLYGKTRVAHGNVEPERFKGIKLAYASADFFNPVNVEAAIRIAEEIPVVGNGVSWLHHKTDHLLEAASARLANSIFGKAITGFHIGKNLKAV